MLFLKSFCASIPKLVEVSVSSKKKLAWQFSHSALQNGKNLFLIFHILNIRRVTAKRNDHKVSSSESISPAQKRQTSNVCII